MTTTRPIATARMYRRCLGAHLRAALEYEADFWILVVASIMMQATGVIFLGAVFARIPTLAGWTLAEVVLIYSLVVIAEGVGSLCFEGTWYLPWMVNQGDLDYTLVRPYPVVLQTMSGAVGLNGVGNLLTGGLLMAWSLSRVDVDWSPLRIALAVALFLSAVLIKLSVTLASTSACFWVFGASFMLPTALHQVGELAKYPVSVYSAGIRVALTVVIPFAFVSFYPAAAVLGHGQDSWVGLLTPLVAGYCVVVAGAVFRRGLRRYESSGN